MAPRILVDPHDAELLTTAEGFMMAIVWNRTGRSVAAVIVAILVAGLAERASCREEVDAATASGRTPANDAELRYWLQNMVWDHGFTNDEVAAATNLTLDRVREALTQWNIAAGNRPTVATGRLRVLPYPGGRHPRIGFLDGAVNPQRETKVSVFTPWDAKSYVVVDVPEAIWSNLGLTYLAHTHVPTVWSKQGITLPPLEWNRRADGSLDIERPLPNGIRFGATVVPLADGVRMELWLTNGTSQPLSDLRIQTCVMLKGAAGFEQQTNDNKVFRGSYCAVRSAEGNHWIITAWKPTHRAWGNAPCPCLHSDPRLADCAPGETQRAQGWLSFYTGADIEAELARLEKQSWWTKPLGHAGRQREKAASR